METLGYTPESERTEPQLAHNLLELSEEQATDLKARIAKFNGTIRIFVHPFYWLVREDEASKRQKDNATEVMVFLDKLLSKEKDATPPILVMEEESLADEAATALERFAKNSQNEFYYAPTFNNEGTPKFPDDSEEITDTDTAKNWTRFSAILYSLGVEKVIIAGGDFDVTLLTDEQKAKLLSSIQPFQPFLDQRARKGARNLNYTPKACAGATAAMLAHDFKVEISNFARPISRQGLRTIEQEQ